MAAALLGFLLVLLPRQPDVALLAEQRLEVVTRDHLFLLRVDRARDYRHAPSFFPTPNTPNSSKYCSRNAGAGVLGLWRCFLRGLVAMCLALHFGIMFSNVMHRIKKQ